MAKNVYLSKEADKGYFSDNFFGIIPGKKVIVNYTPESEFTDLNKVLSIQKLVDKYKQ